jgi:hypothetical protein
MKKLLEILLLALLFTSCINVDSCEDYDCFTPPPEFWLEITDKATGENLYKNGTLDSTQIVFTNELGAAVYYEYLSYDSLCLIGLRQIGWEMGLQTYQLQLSDDISLDIQLNMKEMHEDCCTFFSVIDFQILNYEFTKSGVADIYVVKVD